MLLPSLIIVTGSLVSPAVRPGPAVVAQDTGTQEAPAAEEPTQDPLAEDRAQDPEAPSTPEEFLELLRQAEEAAGGGGGEVPSLPFTPPGGLQDPEQIHLYRGSDPVEIHGPDSRRSLAYWDQQAILNAGDLVLLGDLANVIVDYPDGMTLNIRGETELSPITGPTDSPRHIQIPKLEQFLSIRFFTVQSLIELPGGNALVAANTLVTVRRPDPAVLEVRNTGPSPIFLRGPYLGEELLELQGGQYVWLPQIGLPGQGPTGRTTTHQLGEATMPLHVVVEEDVDAVYEGQTLRLSSRSPATSVASVCGARLILEPGADVALRRVPLGYSRPYER